MVTDEVDENNESTTASCTSEASSLGNTRTISGHAGIIYADDEYLSDHFDGENGVEVELTNFVQTVDSDSTETPDGMKIANVDSTPPQ
jgi:hypothetical protein